MMMYWLLMLMSVATVDAASQEQPENQRPNTESQVVRVKMWTGFEVMLMCDSDSDVESFVVVAVDDGVVFVEEQQQQ